MNHRPVILSVPSIAVAVLLASCGGGGGDGTPVQEPPPGVATVDVAQAWRNLLAADATWQASGPGPNNTTFTVSLRSTPASPAAFPRNGQIGSTTVQTYTISGTGVPAEIVTSRLFYNSGNLFGVDNDDGSCGAVQMSLQPLPGASPVGTSGPLSTSNEYDSCTGQTAADGTTVDEWAVVSDAGITFFCVQSREFDRAGVLDGRGEVCFEASPPGALGSRARFTVYLPDMTALVLKNY